MIAFALFLWALLAPLCAGAGELLLGPREPLTAGALRSLVEAALPPEPTGRRLEPIPTAPALPLANPSERPVAVAVEGLVVNETGDRFSADLVVRIDGAVTGVVPLRGRLRPLVEVPTPARPLAEGETLGPDALASLWLPESSLRPDLLLDAEAIFGREAARRLLPGRPIREADLRIPRLVRKGEIVTLLFARAGIEITTQGRALEDGAAGERIRNVNLASERPVVGRVIGRKLVRVGPENDP